jgi:hypothetical protein
VKQRAVNGGGGTKSRSNGQYYYSTLDRSPDAIRNPLMFGGRAQSLTTLENKPTLPYLSPYEDSNVSTAALSTAVMSKADLKI